MKRSRLARVAVLLATFAVLAVVVGYASAKQSAAACAEDFSATLTPLSVEHPQIKPVVRTQVLGPYLVRASSKVPLTAGHAKYYSRTYLALFGSIRVHDSVEVYLL